MPRPFRIALYGLGLLTLLHWSDNGGHDIPKWVWVLLMAPFLWMAMSEDDDWTDSDSLSARFFRAVGMLYLIVAGMFGIVVGGVALTLKGSGTLFEIFWLALPAGIAILAFALLSWLYRSRNRE